MKPQSARAKGKRMELKVAKLIREKLGIKAHRTPLSGAAEGFKGDIFVPDLPFYWECKNREKIHIWSEWQKIRDHKNPVLVISGNFRPILVVMDIELFLEILKEWIPFKSKILNVQPVNENK
jgi:hypothetical protein